MNEQEKYHNIRKTRTTKFAHARVFIPPGSASSPTHIPELLFKLLGAEGALHLLKVLVEDGKRAQLALAAGPLLRRYPHKVKSCHHKECNAKAQVEEQDLQQQVQDYPQRNIQRLQWRPRCWRTLLGNCRGGCRVGRCRPLRFSVVIRRLGARVLARCRATTGFSQFSGEILGLFLQLSAVRSQALFNFASAWKNKE